MVICIHFAFDFQFLFYNLLTRSPYTNKTYLLWQQYYALTYNNNNIKNNNNYNQ